MPAERAAAGHAKAAGVVDDEQIDAAGFSHFADSPVPAPPPTIGHAPFHHVAGVSQYFFSFDGRHGGLVMLDDRAELFHQRGWKTAGR